MRGVQRKWRWAVVTLACVAGEAPPLAAQRPAAVPMKAAWSFVAGQSVFHTPRSLAVVGNCQLWVADAIAGLWRLGCQGGTPQVIGRQGLGPGEYQQAWALAAASADSIALFDRVLQRVTVYAIDGSSHASRELRLPEASLSELTALAYAGGSLRVWTSQFPPAADPGALHTLVLAFRATGQGHDTLAVLGGLASVYWGSAFGGSRLAVPHQRKPLIAFLADGGFVAGSNDEAQVVVHDPGGRAVRTISLDIPAAPAVTRADREAYADSVRAVTERDMAALHYNAPERAKYRAQIETFLKEDVSYPARRQLHDRLVVDAHEGALWVLVSGTGRSYARTWLVYDLATGALRTRATVPHKGAVTAATVRDGALFVVEQPLGGQASVTRYGPP